MQAMGKRLLEFWERYSRPINLGALAAGFCFDLYIAKRPDSVPDNILLLFYLCMAGTVIVLLNIRSRRMRDRESPTEPLLLLIVLQFCFGGLASNLLILYGHSGTVGGSLFFVALLASFAVGNEFLKSRYAQLRFNVAVYYLLLLTYCIIALPTFVLHKIGWAAFLWSSFASVVVISLFLYILLFTLSKRDRTRNLYEVLGIVVSILFIFNLFYYFNIIPPVPLSLKQIGIYHELTVLPESDQSSGFYYAASYEKPDWWVFWRDTSGTYTLPQNQTTGAAYCFSAVFAPNGLSAPLTDIWQLYNESTKHWETQSTFSFPINGGRTAGYREWSKVSVTPGSWRCNVSTATGQLVGRISFDVVESSENQALSTTTL
jgi:Protein of unknown function (DUF2914)